MGWTKGRKRQHQRGPAVDGRPLAKMIRVDPEVRDAIEAGKRPGERLNDVVRRLLQLDK